MPKLSASTPADLPTEVTRVDITPEMIKSSTDQQLNDLLRQLRGNREVSSSKPRGASSGAPRATKEPAASLDDTLDDE